ncbi:MAG: type II toxin-antitoxin system HicA family toxin, partial [Nanoarchaeota archaeon]|nr:type II toxin-antitoxin system HicA family toxin [Nanoarchaeota archaeon]
MLMSKTPVLSGLEVVKALRNAGFEIVGRKGSHVRMKRKSENKSSIA